MTELTSLEKEQAFEEYKLKQEKLYKRGKLIISIIVVFQIVVAFLKLIAGNYFGFVLNVVLAVALCFGIRWVRYLLAATNLLGVLSSLFMLFNIVTVISNESAQQFVANSQVLLLDQIFSIVVCLFISLTLFFSKAVTEFMYAQRN